MDIRNYLLNVGKKIFLAPKNVPGVVAIKLLDQCNALQKCIGCYAEEFDKNQKIPKETLEEIISFFEKKGTRVFSLLGGEPLLYNNLLEIISGHNKSTFFMYTNGLFIPEKINDLKKTRNIFSMLSLDGSKKTHDARRWAESYELIVRGHNKLEENSIPHGISTTAYLNNYKEISDGTFMRPFEGNYMGLWNIIQYMAKPSRKLKGLNSKQKNNLYEKIDTLKKEKKYFILNIPNDEFKFTNKCQAGKNIIYVKPNGDIASCIFIKKYFANWYNDSPEEVLKKSQFIDGCNKCKSQGI